MAARMGQKNIRIVVHRSNTAVKAAPFGRWTLRDKASRSAAYLQR